MAAPAIPPIRLGLIGTGLAVEKLHWQALRRLADRYVVNRVHRPVRRAEQAVRRLQRGRSTRAAADRAVPRARDDADAGALQAANSTMDAPSDLALNLVFTARRHVAVPWLDRAVRRAAGTTHQQFGVVRRMNDPAARRSPRCPAGCNVAPVGKRPLDRAREEWSWTRKRTYQGGRSSG